ncbi:MAG: hypothetical protein PQJ61_04445 [Spirochaetales bacterium]|uniref:Uncharacterized protein n=1 Tax=Candidatus Thalassospirochaeta sargassi TaxID=3119039 RepID=A0AAJ1IGV2_9SPIO|nr:hypothetical protein [Spirochaetales bacterium]
MRIILKYTTGPVSEMSGSFQVAASEITIGSKEIRGLSGNMLEQNRVAVEAIIEFREMISKYTLKEAVS